MYILYIANKNYSSWSLRPWVLMRELSIGFEERLVPFHAESNWTAFRKFSPSGKVPCLIDGERTVWDSLAITEYLAEKHPAVWPADVSARAWARCAAAEMHSGFLALRENCSMSCGIRARLNEMPGALKSELQRLNELWTEGLKRFAGPFLGGSSFSAVDAFYAPVAFRIQTYGLTLSDTAAAYAARLLDLASMKQWFTAALAERWREDDHEATIARLGVILEDLRAA
jgi:glutathione S-transferase